MPTMGQLGLGSRRGRRLAAALFNKITDAGVTCAITQHQDVVGEDGLCRGWQGHPSIATSSRMCPRLMGGWASWPEAGQSHPSHCRDSPATPFTAYEGNRLGLSVGAKCG